MTSSPRGWVRRSSATSTASDQSHCTGGGVAIAGSISGAYIHHMVNNAPRHALPDDGLPDSSAPARPHHGRTPTPGRTAVDVRGLVVVRGRREVLHGLDVQIPEGQVVGLLGPSGGGKSTLIRSIVGVQLVKDGTIEVLGHPAGSKELRDRVGYVTQAPSVYDDLSIAQNVRYFGSILGRSHDEADQAIATVGLADHAHQLVGNLSGGQRSRASLAAALVGRPELLVLDEPTVGLDPVTRRSLWDLFHSLADTGTTLLVSSHVMDEATRCDRLLLLREGRILADETPDELLDRTGAADAETAFLALIDADTQEA